MPDAHQPIPDDLDTWEIASPEPGDTHLALVEGIVALGHNRGLFYYLSRSAGQVFELSPGQHTKTGLMAMASVPHYWERTKHFSPKGGVKWEDAAGELMSNCRDVGIYDPGKVRGRGAWMDQDRAILHGGDRLLVEGRAVGLVLPGSRHVYEASTALVSGLSDPLTTADAHRLVLICKQFRWESSVSGTLLAGWIAIAAVCGGLAWRPSIWITGGSGSGKTYIKDNVVAPALGQLALLVQSKTSEAGIRQALGSDARPVLFDEAEAEDQTAAARMQGVLDLVRQSSSEGGADIVKGSADGRARRYRIRSCFAFWSINAGILHEADANRITVLALRQQAGEQDESAFQALHAQVVQTVTPEFAAGLVARSVWLLPVIRINAERFARAVSVHLGSRRTGDQYGALLAGAYSLHSEREISEADAVAFVERQDWTVVSDSESERDEYRLLSHLTQFRIRIAAGNGVHLEPTIGQAILAAWGRDTGLAADIAQDELRRTGIRPVLEREGIWVSNTHPALRRIMAGTPWAAGWARSLTRLPDTKKSANCESFAFGHIARAVWVPLQTINPVNPLKAR